LEKLSYNDALDRLFDMANFYGDEAQYLGYGGTGANVAAALIARRININPAMMWYSEVLKSCWRLFIKCGSEWWT
jgi:hypothetical protein